jgi:hypothetical protein
MSCDWDIKCVDCDVAAGIDNANHQLELMQALIANAKELQEFLKALAAHEKIYSTELLLNGYYIPIDFFVAHGDHHLRPIDEYGCFDTPCQGAFLCPRCQQMVACEDREHPRRQAHIHYVNHMGHWEK